MKSQIIAILMLLFILAGCAQEVPSELAEPTTAPTTQEQPTGEITDEQILAEYDDDLDAALAELDLIE